MPKAFTTKPPVRYYREIERGEQLVVFGDPAESNDFCSAVAFSKKYFDYPLVFNQVIESSQFGYELYNLCKFINMRTELWPKLGVERNTGQATIFVLRNLNYPNLFRMVDFTAQNNTEGGQVGWVTTGSLQGGQLVGTRKKMLDDLALALKQGQMKIYDEDQLRQMMSFIIVRGGRAQAKANKHDDLVMATAGAWQVHLVTPAEFLDDYDPHEAWEQRQRWRFK